MPDQDKSVDIDANSKANSKYTAKSETERLLSVLEAFGQRAGKTSFYQKRYSN